MMQGGEEGEEEGTFSALKIAARNENKLSSSHQTKTFTLQTRLSGCWRCIPFVN